MALAPAVMRRLMREIGNLKTNPPEGIRIVTSEDNMLDVTGIIEGPEGTPYAGGYFKVRFKFTEEFPSAPPKCWFATKIFHPNVSSAGEICVNTLKKDWVSTYGIEHILVTVKCLLIYPNPESALDEEAGKLLLEDYENYCERARLITSVHATPKERPKEFEVPAKGEPKLTVAGSSKTATAAVATPSSAPVITTAPTVTTIPSSPATTITTATTITATTGNIAALKSPSQPPQSQPLQSTMSNTPQAAPTAATKEKDRDRHVSPTPLSTANANVGTTNTKPSTVVSKAGKRSAPVASAGQRKKALKRL